MTGKRVLFAFAAVLFSLANLSACFGEASFNVVGDLSYIFNLEPGGRAMGEITVENEGDEDGDVKIYFVDYLHYADGRNLFEKAGSSARSNAPWFSVSPGQANIPARGSLRVHYSLSVPANPALRGTYWSILMVEPIPRSFLTPADQKDDVNVRVVTVARFGIQMISNIGRAGEVKIRFLDKSLVKEGGKSMLRLDVINEGEKLATPHVWAEFFNSKGKSSGPIDGSRQRIYPGCSGRYMMDLSGLAPGGYQIVVVADNGDDNVFGANYAMDLK